MTASTSLKDAEILFNTYLTLVGCGTSCTRGYLVRRVAGNSFSFDITVSATSSYNAYAIAQCFNSVMNNGSSWNGGTPGSTWPDDPDYYAGCRYGLFNWSYCASWCYSLYTHGNYSCCSWWYNRCYAWSCETTTISCNVSWASGGGSTGTGDTGYNVTTNGTCSKDPVCRSRMSRWVWGSTTPSLSMSTQSASPSYSVESRSRSPSSVSHTSSMPYLDLNAAELSSPPLSPAALSALLVGAVAGLICCVILILILLKRRRSQAQRERGRSRRNTRVPKTLEDLRNRGDSQFIFQEVLDEELIQEEADVVPEHGEVELKVVVPPPPPPKRDAVDVHSVARTEVPPPPPTAAQMTGGERPSLKLPTPPPMPRKEHRFDDI